MLIRVRGHNDGIKGYLETGQKQDREMSRDELDERVILAGDLELSNEIIQAIDTDADRYLHITLSFKEDYIERTRIESITREVEEFMFAAYRPDEYSFYAEAHLPKVRSYANRKSGDPIERKPHVHIVVPLFNLLSGQRLAPFGLVEHQTKYLEAIQEHINNRYGLASPKDNRRVELTDASEMISRYKGDVFEGTNRDIKAQILEAVMTRQVTDYEAFKELVKEFGDTRTRNAGRPTEYENVKLTGAPKGVNLKEYVFSREFIQLQDSEKRAAIAGQATTARGYDDAGVSRESPPQMLETLREWREVASREAKYLNGAFRQTYREASPEERRAILTDREQRFYQRFDNEVIYDGRSGRAAEHNGLGRQHSTGRGDSGREQSQGKGWEVTTPGPGIGADPEYDLESAPRRTPAAGIDRLRDMSGLGLDGDPLRIEMLLPDHARSELDQRRPETPNALRRPDAGDRTGAAGRGLAGDWRDLLAAEYQAYEAASAIERRTVHAAGARRLRRSYDQLKGGGRMPGSFEEPAAPTVLHHTTNLNAVPELGSMGGAGGRGRARRGKMTPKQADRLAGQFDRSKTGSKQRHTADVIDAPRVLRNVGGSPEERVIAGASTRRRTRGPRNTATGREADAVLHQLSRDLEEAKRARSEGPRTEFETIKQELNAERLLLALSHSHGVLASKYQIVKGRDGADRIQSGSRKLNVSDFLTRELNLPWSEAAQILRGSYRQQIADDPQHAARQTPQQQLWREYQADRSERLLRYRDRWIAQGTSERQRRGEIKNDYRAERSKIVDDTGLKPGQKKAALSLARMQRIERDAELRAIVARERDTLKAETSVPLDEQYREFLTTRAQGGDPRALEELRRMQRDGRHEPTPGPRIAPIAVSLDNAIVYRGPSITHEVHRNGDVTYKRDGVALLDDEGRSLRLWEADSQAIETALRLAQQKFGRTLVLTGPEEFQMTAARVAAEAGLTVQFSDDALNTAMKEHRTTLDAQNLARREAQREQETALRAAARAAPAPQRNDQQATPPEQTPDHPEPDPGIER